MGLKDLQRNVTKLRDEVAGIKIRESVEERFSRFRDDPVAFVRDVLGGVSATRRSTGDSYQLEVLRDLAIHPRVAVRSGHGVGKSTVDAWAVIWWLLTRPYSRVVVVAPEFSRQVRAVLFAEIRKWVRRANVELPLQVLANRVCVEGYGDEWSAIGLPATEPSRIEGFHAEGGVLLILDETKGIPDEVYDALQGALTGEADNRLLVTSTPGAPSGVFFRIHHEARDDWRLHHLSSEDSSLVSEGWVEQRRREWGEDSPLYQARVLGLFPEEEEGTLYRLCDLEAAVARELQPVEGDAVVLGVDPARFGPDRTAIAVWRGKTLLEVRTRVGMDTMKTAAWVASEIHRHNPGRVRIDEIGIGAGVVDRLRQLGHDVEDVNVARRASRPDLFVNSRAEMAWGFREALERGEVSLPDDEALLAELSAFRYGYDPKGRIRLEEKSNTRRELGRSPDKADAALLGFAAARRPMGRYGLIGGRVFDFDEMKYVSDDPTREWGQL